MKIIAHRGNTNGPSDQENHPIHLEKALLEGYDVEADVWVIENKIFLGHNKPQYAVNFNNLFEIKNNLWIHCKNLAALNYFDKENFNFFWHENDKFTLTSKGFIWTYPDEKLSEKSVIVDLNWKNSNIDVYGICTDYVRGRNDN
ncbi:hypothetical protein UFOVP204_103 [uncultured Caudovirales phage]|uniref:Uncharacterized protein n=1 Tax=uncultured Caudovirales phage TaxID=2100421 RepID=A0A6J7WJQ1_9CAUD|nr:hypothetical protein UFOVP204_103 [uncultured Caudovirales phage]